MCIIITAALFGDLVNILIGILFLVIGVSGFALLKIKDKK